jgi:predicted nucleic acid-binding protein
MAVVCDTAVLIAADRQDRRVAALARAAATAGEELVVPVGCVAQAWRDPARQAALGLFLRGCREVPLDPAAARAAGLLLAKAGLTDVIDASVAAAAQRGDSILTSDPGDIGHLAAEGGVATVTRF